MFVYQLARVSTLLHQIRIDKARQLPRIEIHVLSLFPLNHLIRLQIFAETFMKLFMLFRVHQTVI